MSFTLHPASDPIPPPSPGQGGMVCDECGAWQLNCLGVWNFQRIREHYIALGWLVPPNPEIDVWASLCASVKWKLRRFTRIYKGRTLCPVCVAHQKAVA